MCRNDTVCHRKCVFLAHPEPEGKEARCLWRAEPLLKTKKPKQKFPRNKMRRAYRIPSA